MKYKERKVKLRGARGIKTQEPTFVEISGNIEYKNWKNIEKWLNENSKGRIDLIYNHNGRKNPSLPRLYIYPTTIQFGLKEDAALFVLFWPGVVLTD